MAICRLLVRGESGQGEPESPGRPVASVTTMRLEGAQQALPWRAVSRWSSSENALGFGVADQALVRGICVLGLAGALSG